MARPEHVRLVAPVGRDAAVLRDALFEGGFHVEVHDDLEALRRHFGEHGAAVLLLTSEALDEHVVSLQRTLEEQPPWSDVPVLVLGQPGEASADLLARLDAVRTRRSVTVLVRPIQKAALASAVRAALWARVRQYEVRDLLLALEQAKERLEERVEERTREVRELATALTMAEQRERRRIAGVLHDDLQQMLYGLQFRLEFARRSLTGQERSEGRAEAPGERGASPDVVDDVLGHLDEADAITGRVIDTARTLTVELSPPVLDSDGLEVVFEWLATHMDEMHGLDVEVEGTCDVEDRDLRVLFFQLGRELLFNVVKHAGTAQARIFVERRDGHAVVRIGDDGRGFDPDEVFATGDDDESGFGLYSVQERVRLLGGEMEVDSRPGSGTSVVIVVPLDGQHTSRETEATDAAT